MNSFTIKIIFFYVLLQFTKLIINYVMLRLLLHLVNVHKITVYNFVNKLNNQKFLNKLGIIDLWIKIIIVIFMSYFFVKNLIIDDFLYFIYFYLVSTKILFFIINLKITIIQVISLVKYKKIKLNSSGYFKINEYKKFLLLELSKYEFIDGIGENSTEKFIQLNKTDFDTKIKLIINAPVV